MFSSLPSFHAPLIPWDVFSTPCPSQAITMVDFYLINSSASFLIGSNFRSSRHLQKLRVFQKKVEAQPEVNPSECPQRVRWTCYSSSLWLSALSLCPRCSPVTSASSANFAAPANRTWRTGTDTSAGANEVYRWHAETAWTWTNWHTSPVSRRRQIEFRIRGEI